MAGTKIIFQGVKFYWRTRNTIDVTVVEHEEQTTTEIVLFDPSLGGESPRIYLSSPVLFSKLDHDDIELQLSFAKRNCVPITEKFMDTIMNKAKSDFILNRLVITEYSVELKKVVVSFQLSGVDCDSAGLICEKPQVFEPFKTVHHQTLMAGVVDQAIAALEVAKAQLVSECNKAQQLEKIADCSSKPLTPRERWRIPIVFIKMSNSKRLNAADAKIWFSVTQNMRTEEDAARMAAVLARPTKNQATPVQSAAPTAAPSRGASFIGEHHSASPCTSPRNRNATHSKLHQPTVATTRHRTEAAHAGAHNLSRQNSCRQSSLRQCDASAHAAAEGAAAVSHRNTTSKDETGELSYNSRAKTSKAPPKTPKRSGSKGGAKRGRKSLFSRLRKSFNGVDSQAAEPADSAVVGSECDGAAVSDTASADVSSGSLEGAEQSTLQRLIANLGSLNTSMRASFGGLTMSGKHSMSVQSDTTKSGQQFAGGAGGTPSAVEATLSEAEMLLAITQVNKPKSELKRGSFLFAKPGSDNAVLSTGSGKQGPLAAVHKFISDMVNWRPANKIHVDCA